MSDPLDLLQSFLGESLPASLPLTHPPTVISEPGSTPLSQILLKTTGSIPVYNLSTFSSPPPLSSLPLSSLKPSSIKGLTPTSSQIHRSDLSVFLPPSTISPLITHVSSRIVSRIFPKNSSWSSLSCQLAAYPENSTGYVEHCDVQGSCLNGDEGDDNNNNDESRILTIIYYLGYVNLTTLEVLDYSPSFGGELNVKSPDSSSSTTIKPSIGNLLTFNSCVSRHSVLPLNSTHGFHRLALTLWYSSPSPSFLKLNSKWYLSAPPLLADKYDDESIFIGIPSFNDNDIINTLKSIYLNATNPNKIYVGLLAQYDDWGKIYSEFESGYNLKPFKKNIRILNHHPSLSTGPMNSRYLCQGLYRNETYYLSIDAHTRFRKGWDSYLIQDYKLVEDNSKTIITSYPVGWKLENEKAIVDCLDSTVLESMSITKREGTVRQKSNVINKQIKAPPLVAAGFYFVRGLGVKYPSNVHGVFFGEEEFLGIQYFKEGYEFWNTSVGVLFTKWERGGGRKVEEEMGEEERRGVEVCLRGGEEWRKEVGF